MFALNISFLITLMCINIYPVRPINSFVIQYPLFNIQYISDIPQRPIWSGRYSTLILLCAAHTPEAEPILFSLFRWSKKRGGGLFCGSPKKCCAIERNSAHESWPDTKKFRTAKHSTACCAFSCFLIWVAINNIFQHRLQVSAFCSSVLVKTGGTPQTGGTWIVAAIPVKVELDSHQVHQL